MLTITVPGAEFYKEDTNEFLYTSDTVLKMEHSLVSISKWESKWKKPFLSMGQPGNEDFTQEMLMDYFQFMTITQNVPKKVYYGITHELFNQVIDYMRTEQTATWFSNKPGQGGRVDRRPMTSERIYHLMIHYNIPFECEKWHLSRLLTLIRICQIEEQKPEKQNPRDAALARHSAMAARRAKKPHR